MTIRNLSTSALLVTSAAVAAIGIGIATPAAHPSFQAAKGGNSATHDRDTGTDNGKGNGGLNNGDKK